LTDPQQLFRHFVDTYREDGSADPRPYLAQAEGVDREELRTLIEAFLERAPRRQWDADAYAGSLAERAVMAAQPESAEGVEAWPVLLPKLRTRARLKRATVVARLAAALGFQGSERRVAAYYHGMEQGLLPPSGVSTKVLEALGSILDVSVEALRDSGLAGQRAAEVGGEVFARLAAPPDAIPSSTVEALEMSLPDRASAPDELDLLFTGGD
jgi:hypothetical protein